MEKILEFFSGTATDWTCTAALKPFVLRRKSLFVGRRLGEYEWQKEIEHLLVHVNIHPRLSKHPGLCMCVCVWHMCWDAVLLHAIVSDSGADTVVRSV